MAPAGVEPPAHAASSGHLSDHVAAPARSSTWWQTAGEPTDPRRFAPRRRRSPPASRSSCARGRPHLARDGDTAYEDLAAYDGVIVLGPDREVCGLVRPDDRTLVTLLLLRDLERTSGSPVTVVTEMTDDRNRAIAPVGPGADFVVSGKLVGLLISQISQNWHLTGLFEELLAPGGNTIQLKPARDPYVRAGCRASFATVVESAARGRGECAIGYRVPRPTRLDGAGVRGAGQPAQVRAPPLDCRRRGDRRGDGLRRSQAARRGTRPARPGAPRPRAGTGRALGAASPRRP